MGCKSLAYVYIPETVSEIGTGVFAGTNAFIEVDEKNYCCPIKIGID